MNTQRDFKMISRNKTQAITESTLGGGEHTSERVDKTIVTLALLNSNNASK